VSSLTVVVTCYNRERYIGASIESVLASSLADFELLVLDDASTDGSVAVARSLAALDRRVRVVVNERNLGQFGNRNHALEHVETAYLKYHDSDDLMYPHCLDTMVRLLEGEPRAGFALSAGRAWLGGPCPMLSTPRLSYQREFLGEGMFHCGPSGALFRTEVLKQLGGFPERGVASDFCFWLKACAVRPVLLVPADLFWYRIHPEQELRSAAAPRDYAVAQGDAWRALHSPDCPLEAEELVRAKRSCLFRLLRSSLRDIKSGQVGLAKLRLKSAGIRLADWIRYPPRPFRDPLAGAPLGADGSTPAPSAIGSA
jgi:hypothetical protein